MQVPFGMNLSNKVNLEGKTQNEIGFSHLGAI